MLPQLPVATNHDGQPFANVAGNFMWDLVEYLSCQRVAVTYQYDASHFTVIFNHCDLPSAQQILDGWSRQLTPERMVA